MPSLYTFVDYSPEWPEEFAREAARLTALLGDELIAVHHIGSTAVPGLAAKPIIDLLPVARDIARIDLYTEQMQTASYKPWGEYGLVGRRFFTKDRGEYRTHNIHIFGEGNPAIARHLALCAYLRAHPVVADEYAALKRAIYARHPADIAAYNNAKHDFVKQTEQVALAWLRSRTN
jgi:GrpB-like predicted nucleotidyltransferase (UPF0157 family)